jgi:hypothetical protein
MFNNVPVPNGPLNFEKQSTFRKVEKSAKQFCECRNYFYLENDLPLSFAPVAARIIAYGHHGVFQAYRKLPENRREQFLEELKFIDIDFMDLVFCSIILALS